MTILSLALYALALVPVGLMVAGVSVARGSVRRTHRRYKGGGARRSRTPHPKVPAAFKAAPVPDRFTLHWRKAEGTIPSAEAPNRFPSGARHLTGLPS